jgi:NAD(P)-dependent dehydrogenase (short-subunit alcohol dehydrogenase family)
VVTHLVHNAGVIRPASLDDTRLQDVQALTQLHIGAALTLTQAFLPAMKAARFGRIVLMSSRGVLGLANRTAYGATKAGMIGLARSWALELAPVGITVNVVAPGPIGDTEMFRGVIPAGDPREQSLAGSIPVKRLGRSDDVARAVMFFSDRRNDFVTGQTLYVCGGTSVGSLIL